jgi:hypothetical protein
MQYTGINKWSQYLEVKMPTTFLGSIQTSIEAFNSRRRHTTTSSVVRDDWYPMNTPPRPRAISGPTCCCREGHGDHKGKSEY